MLCQSSRLEVSMEAGAQRSWMCRIDKGIVETGVLTLETPHLYWGQRDETDDS